MGDLPSMCAVGMDMCLTQLRLSCFLGFAPVVRRRARLERSFYAQVGNGVQTTLPSGIAIAILALCAGRWWGARTLVRLDVYRPAPSSRGPGESDLTALSKH